MNNIKYIILKTATERKFRIVITLIALIGICNNILASENNLISGKLRTELFAINNYNSNNKKEEFKEYESRTKLSINFNISDTLSIKTVTRMSEMRQNLEDNRRDYLDNGSGSRSFENHGIFLDQLYLEYNRNNFGIFAGKNTINFGSAWKRNNNILIINKASKYYRFDEKFSFGTMIKGGNRNSNGEYILTLSSYFNDNKYLDNSIFTKRDYVNRSSINIGDDKSFFASYHAALDINYDFGDNEILTYHFGYIKSAINDRQSNIVRSNIKDQKSYVANIGYQIPITNNIIPKIFIEYAFLDNFEGSKVKTNAILSKYLIINLYQNYYVTYNRTDVKYKELYLNGKDEASDEFSIGYKFNQNSILNGLSVNIGYANDKIDEKINSQRIESAILYLRYAKIF